jgi:hypothetical protein
VKVSALALVALLLAAEPVAAAVAAAAPPITSYDLLIRRGVPGDTYRFDAGARAARAARPKARHIEFILAPPIRGEDRFFGPDFPPEGLLFHYSFSADAQRIDDPANGISVLVRCAQHRVFMLDHENKTYWEPLLPSSMSFRGGGAQAGVAVNVRAAVQAVRGIAGVRADAYQLRVDSTSATGALATTTIEIVLWLLDEPEAARCGGGLLPEDAFFVENPSIWYSNTMFLLAAEGATVRSDGPRVPKGRFALYTRLFGRLGGTGVEDSIVLERGTIRRGPLPASIFAVPAEYAPAQAEPRRSGP